MLAGTHPWNHPVTSPLAMCLPVFSAPVAEDAVTGPVALTLLSLAQPLELEVGLTVTVTETVTLADLAAQAGVTPNGARAALDHLATAGLLTAYRGRYILHDAPALRRAALPLHA